MHLYGRIAVRNLVITAIITVNCTVAQLAQEVALNKLHRLTQSETVGSHTNLLYVGVWGYVWAI